MKTIAKRNLLLFLSLLTIILSITISFANVSADDANAKLDAEVNKYVGDSKEFTDVIEKMAEDSAKDKAPSKNTINHVMKRLFNAGEYINDVEYGVLDGDLGVSKSDVLSESRYACNPSAPNNLINHNCNIPNFTTGLLQSIAAPFSEPFLNAEKTSSYTVFGVPEGIPGGTVPVNPGSRANTYTALELFGYDLKLTSYGGEWDKIDVSTEARMLSNFGVIDKVTLMGTGLWNSVKSGVGGLIENFSFNPMRWIADTANATVSGGLNTVLDTSDLNIVATNGWKRNDFSKTLYNVYVMTDKEVLQETANNYFREFINHLQANAELSPELSGVLELEKIPGFEFIPNWETPESIAAIESAVRFNNGERYKASQDIEYMPKYKTVPKPVYYTEKQQLGFWGTDNKSIVDKANGKGLLSGGVKAYDNYQSLSDDWNKNWQNLFAKEFSAMGDTVTNLLEKSDNDVFKNNPHLDPKQPISHYACANDDGTIKRKSDGKIEYVYLKNNKGGSEYLNTNCSPARKPIGGGLFGSGWHVNRDEDTRHIDNIIKSDFLSSRTDIIGNGFMSFFRSINSFVARMTNTILGLAFSPILSELGIDEIVAQLVEGFKKTIFFPLASLVAALGAFMLFLQLLKGAGAWQLIASIGVTILIFVAGVAFFMYPQSTIKLIDEVPTRIDNIIANAVLVDDDGTSYCSSGDGGNAIRSAQCNVWGIMVFNPWTHLQFGTGYDNLYAKGYAKSGGSAFTNENASLVGDAGVYMGGGKTVNNWAMYQLDKTKAGTINSSDTSSTSGLGTVDKNLFRLVDLQAGPNNGAGTDSSNFATWSGKDDGSFFIGLLTTMQAILAAIAIAGLSITKIEVSFLFSLSIIILPIMMLFALLPQGQLKFKGYISMLGSLLLKRFVVTAMLSVLLKTLSLSYSRSDSIVAASMLSIAISVAFLMYKKELLNLITGSDGPESQLKEIASQSVPNSVKQRYAMVKAQIQGAALGFVGGVAGKTAYSAQSEVRSRNIQNKLKKLDKKEVLTEEEQEQRSELINERIAISQTLEESGGLLAQGVNGARSSSRLISRRTERSIRREGFSGDKVITDAKNLVYDEGADSITNKFEDVELDTYKEVLSHSENKISKTSDKPLSTEDARALRNPEVQKEIRRLAEKRRKHIKDNNNSKYIAKTPDSEELERLAEIIDKKRKAAKIKGYVKSPYLEKEIQKESKLRKQSSDITSNVEEIKAQLIQAEKVKSILRDKEKAGVKDLTRIKDEAREIIKQESNKEVENVRRKHPNEKVETKEESDSNNET